MCVWGGGLSLGIRMQLNNDKCISPSGRKACTCVTFFSLSLFFVLF